MIDNHLFQKIKCPTCGKYRTWSNDNYWKPFCSKICKYTDLNKWLMI